MPTAAHFIYIPVMLMLGVVLGYALGTRAARDAFAAEQARREARAARQAARLRAEREKSPPGGEAASPQAE